MKTVALYGLAAALYVVGGMFMKYSRGLTRLLPTVALVALFSTGALTQAWAMRRDPLGPSYVVVLGLEAMLAVVMGSVMFGEAIGVKTFVGVLLVVMGIVVLRAI
jgi:small multidrug resistance pump